MQQRRRYLSFLLRMWQESDGDAQEWRASLERPQGGERRGFTRLKDMFAFLENEISGREPSAHAMREKQPDD